MPRLRNCPPVPRGTGRQGTFCARMFFDGACVQGRAEGGEARDPGQQDGQQQGQQLAAGGDTARGHLHLQGHHALENALQGPEHAQQETAGTNQDHAFDALDFQQLDEGVLPGHLLPAHGGADLVDALLGLRSDQGRAGGGHAADEQEDQQEEEPGRAHDPGGVLGIVLQAFLAGAVADRQGQQGGDDPEQETQVGQGRGEHGHKQQKVQSPQRQGIADGSRHDGSLQGVRRSARHGQGFLLSG